MSRFVDIQYIGLNYDKVQQSNIIRVRVCRGSPIMLTKQQAAEFLGVTVRTLERYTKEGKIGGRYEKGKTRSVLVYDESELEAFKLLVETTTYKPAVDHTPTNTDNSDLAVSRLGENQLQLPLLQGLSELIEVIKSNQSSNPLTVPIDRKLTLSLSEASLLSGLSRSRLRIAIKDGQLIGQIIGKGFRVKRADLEDYINRL